MLPLFDRRNRGRRLAIATGAVAAALVCLPAAAGAAQSSAYLSDYGAAVVDPFTVGSNQTLSLTGSSVPASNQTWFEAVTPNGKYMYVANWGDGTVNEYSVGQNGQLAALSQASVQSGAEAVQVAISPDGRNLYVANGDSGGNTPGSLWVYDIGSDGGLTHVQTITSGLSSATAVAVSPDGSSVYVGSGVAQEIFQYNRATDGTLTPKSTATVTAAGIDYVDLAIAPSGKYLYESTESGTINEFTVGSGGELTQSGSVTTGVGAYSVIVSPNGKNAYSSSCNDSNVYQYSVGSDGQLSPLSPASVPTDGCGLPWMTANGASLYAPDNGSQVYQFDVASTGGLTPKSPATVSVPNAGSVWGIILPPDQGPLASFTSKVGKAGKASSFDASASSDSDGTVVSYAWSFGDGSSTTTTGPKVSHTYKKAGTHTVTLTVTDDSGCSTNLVFTGQTNYCTPGTAASHTVKVAAARKPLKLGVSPKHAKAGHKTCYVFTATSSGHRVKRVSVKLAGHAAHTAGNGKVRLCLALKRGVHTARASKSGYAAATARIRVSAAAAAPAFTG